MAIDFYELGKRSGAKTPKGQQSGFESLVSSAIKPIEDMLANSKAATAALTAAMPAGVPIEKVPEELRGQVTNFLTENKAAYKDATKVLASGINPSSERYTEAVEVINRVNSRFENLSGNLENIALERQKYLDDPNYSPNTSRSNATIMSNLANGSLYSSMTVNEDGSWNYKDTNGESKAFKDFRIDKQGYLGQQGHLAMVEHLNKNAYDINGNVKNWEGDLKDYYNLQVNQLFNTLGPKGSQDYVMADDEFLQARYDSKKLKGTKGNFEDYKDALTQGSKEDLIEDYKQYNLSLLEKQHGNAVAKKANNNDSPSEWTYSSGKYLPVFGGQRQMPPDFVNAMKISLQEAADGKETSFDIFDNRLTYDPKANDGQGNWYDDNNDYGSTSNLIKNTIKVTDPGFVRIGSASSSQAPIKLEALNIKTSAMLPNGEVYENGLVSGILKGSDKLVARNINDIIVSNPKNYKFAEFTGDGSFYNPFGSDDQIASGDIFKATNKEIMILDGNNDPVIDPATKKPYHFKVDDGSKNSENDVDADAIRLNKLLKSLNIKLKPSI